MPNAAIVLTELTETINSFLPADMALDTTEINNNISSLIRASGKFLLDNTLGFAVNLFSLFLYLVLLPLLVFFLLKDKNILLVSVKKYFPSSPIFGELWESVDEQFGSYVRGKLIEALTIGTLSLAAFQLFSLSYAFSLAIIVGLSVFVPFVGAIAVTIPVVALAYLQFGTSSDFFWIIGLYGIIQTFDGQVLVPLLFSEVVKLHPVAIFASIIFFGNLWGVWGVFFAIPLASLIKSVLLVIDARRVV
jgi:putative permease